LQAEVARHSAEGATAGLTSLEMYVRGYHLMPAHHAVSSVLQRRLKVARL
jgi:hypothetical protein